jgi:uncharacterized membrane protein YoaK (UPF0700 family)
MRRYGIGARALAVGLAVLAGFVDAVGFLKLGGLFVSFMSGNSTRLAVDIAATSRVAFLSAALIAAFVGGVMIGAAAGRAGGARRKQTVLAVVTALLLLAATAIFQTFATTLLMAAAMGAANAVFQRDGEVSVGVTYMTGTLVKFGQNLAATFWGGDRSAWVPYLLLWIGLVAGATTGAGVFAIIGSAALWCATVFAALLTAFAIMLERRQHA